MDGMPIPGLHEAAMTIPHNPVSYLFRSLRRVASSTGALAICALLPAQFQYDYGTPGGQLPLAEVGTAVVKMPTGYLVVGQQGNDVAGVLTNGNGGTLISGRHVPMQQGLVLTPECALRTTAGGVIVSGEVQGGTPGNLQVFLAYYAANGAMWPLGGPGAANRYLLYRGDPTGILQGTRVVESNDHGFGVITNVTQVGAGVRGVLFTTLPNGTLVCWNSFGQTGYDVRFHDLVQDVDDTFVIVGSMRSQVGPRRVTMVMRVDACGGIHWLRLYNTNPGTNDVEQHAITKTAAGKFAVWGHFSPTSVSPGSFLFEIDATGAVVFRTHFATIAGTRPTIARATNGDLLMNGKSGDDAVVLRTNSAGLLPVARTYGVGLGSVEEFFQVVPTADGGHVSVGSTQMVSPSRDFYLVKADANGDSFCNWQPLAAPQTFPVANISTRQVYAIADWQMAQLDMQPLVLATEEHPQCVAPRCIYSGDPTGTTGGLPSLDIPLPATLGNSAFQIRASGLVPNGFSMVALSTTLVLPGQPLAMLGGQPGSMLYLDPAGLATFAVLNDANGEAGLTFPIPNNPTLTGLALHWQIFDFDLTLPFALPLGNSQAMSVIIQ